MPEYSDMSASKWKQISGLLAEVKAPLETSRTLPPPCYSEESIHEQELRTIFRRSWVSVGRWDRWKAPGDYAAMEVAGIPIVVLRDNQGVLRAYANTCRHRGAKLLDGEGSCRTIRCPFHRWTYALDGRLLKAPRMDAAPAFDLSTYGLIPVRIDTRAGFVFVCFDDDVEPLDAWLGDFPELHRPWSLSELVSTRRREFELSCNWKSFLEVFNEYYHLPSVHADSFGDIFDPPDAPDEVTGSYASQFGTTQGTGGLLKDSQDQALPIQAGLQGRNREGTRYTWVFPNLTFAAGTEATWIYETHSITPDRTRVHMTTCFHPETTGQPEFEERIEHYYERMDTALEEDIATLENQHAGLCSPLARQGRYCARLEPNVASFAFWYAGQLLDQPSATQSAEA